MKHIKLLAITALSLCLFAVTSCEKAFFPLTADDLVGTKWEGYSTFDGHKQYLLWTFTSTTEAEYELHKEEGKDATKDSPLSFKVSGTYSYNNLKDTFTATLDNNNGYTMADFPYTAEGHFLPSSFTVTITMNSGVKTDPILFIKAKE